MWVSWKDSPVLSEGVDLRNVDWVSVTESEVVCLTVIEGSAQSSGSFGVCSRDVDFNLESSEFNGSSIRVNSEVFS